MTRLLHLAGWRYHRRHLAQGWLMLIGVALGVAVVVAVDVASSAIKHSLRWSMDALTGSATHEIVGGPGGIDEHQYVRLRLAGWRELAPRIQGKARLPAQGDASVTVLGHDLLAEDDRRDNLLRLAEAFQRNLKAFSLLALAVGMLLIYNAFTFSVVQRRPMLARLRALGATRGELARAILGEAALVGLIGAALGVAAGGGGRRAGLRGAGAGGAAPAPAGGLRRRLVLNYGVRRAY